MEEETKSTEEKLHKAIDPLKRNQRELLEVKVSINSVKHKN